MDDLAFLYVQPAIAASRPVPTVLSVINPTLNERENVKPLLSLVTAALPDTEWEVIFVDDDSRDGTAEHVRNLARRNPRVRCLQRIGRRGLSTACIEGVLACASPYIAVMDADLQHDERLLPQMLEVLDSGAADVVIGSRYVAGGGVGDWSSGRVRMSGAATRLAHIICKTDVADPLSGFFMCRREIFEAALRRMSGQGFKVLLDLLASSPEPPRVRELSGRVTGRGYHKTGRRGVPRGACQVVEAPTNAGGDRRDADQDGRVEERKHGEKRT